MGEQYTICGPRMAVGYSADEKAKPVQSGNFIDFSLGRPVRFYEEYLPRPHRHRSSLIWGVGS